MKLEGVLKSLADIKMLAETQAIEKSIISMTIIQLLLDYIGNDKVEEAVDEIPF